MKGDLPKKLTLKRGRLADEQEEKIMKNMGDTRLKDDYQLKKMKSSYIKVSFAHSELKQAFIHNLAKLSEARRRLAAANRQSQELITRLPSNAVISARLKDLNPPPNKIIVTPSPKNVNPPPNKNMVTHSPKNINLSDPKYANHSAPNDIECYESEEVSAAPMRDTNSPSPKDVKRSSAKHVNRAPSETKVKDPVAPIHEANPEPGILPRTIQQVPSPDSVRLPRSYPLVSERLGKSLEEVEERNLQIKVNLSISELSISRYSDSSTLPDIPLQPGSNVRRLSENIENCSHRPGCKVRKDLVHFIKENSVVDFWFRKGNLRQIG